MTKLLAVGLLLFGPFCALGQGPAPLSVYTSPDGGLRFAYPENYELLVGERIVKGTQGRHAGIPVCDFTTALACVIYPIDRFENSNFEGAGFSVNGVSAATSEGDCLGYAEKTIGPHAEQVSISSLSINDRVFRNVHTTAVIAGHLQSASLYRAFQKNRCYELRIAISLSDVSSASSGAEEKALANGEANKVWVSLELILSSFRFLQ